MAKKTIITAAVTGAWPKKENNPNVPMTPQEIADDVYACWKAGAAIAHLHMRDENGDGTMDTAKFEETVNLIHTKYPDCDIILNLTTSGDIHADDEIRVAHVKKLKPEMASYDCGSMNWLHSGLFINSPKFLTDCGLLFQETNTKPEIEAFDPGMIGNAAYYIKKGVLKTPVHFQFCMGCANGIPGTMKNLIFMKETADELVGKGNYTWSCFGVGHSAMEMLYGAVALGGGIRVGMEDNVVYGYDKEGKKILANNLMLVERAARAVEAYGNEVATSAEAREMLGLAPLDHEAVVKALDALTIEDLEKAKAEASEKYGTTYFAAKSMG